MLAARLLCFTLVAVVVACTPAAGGDDVDPAEGEGEGGGEGEGEGEGEPVAIGDLVTLGEAIRADSGPAVPIAMVPHPPAGFVVVDLGALVVDAAGVSGAFFVDVDERVTGLTPIVYGDDGAVVMLTSVIDPDGVVVVDDEAAAEDTPGYAQIENLSRGFTGQFTSPGRVLPASDVGAFFVPSTADIPLVPGRWRLRVGQFDVGTDDNADPVVVGRAGAVRVFVVLKTASTSTASARVAFHFTGGGGLTATTAPKTPAFVAAVSELQQIYGDAGVDLGDGLDDVDLIDHVDGEGLQTIALDLPRCDGPELDGIASLGRPDRLNIHVVDRFECGNFGPFLLGLAAGLPLVPWTGGTPHSGVVVAGSFFVDDPTTLSTVLAHELGHGFGLYHSQENNRFGDALYDVIADTADDDEGARANIMYFDVARMTAKTLTPQQAATIRRGPLVLP